MKTTLTIWCILSAMSAVGADKKSSAKKTSLSAAELRTLATSIPSAKNAGMLYSVAQATSNNVERKQEYLKAAAACLIACDKNDIYKKHIKGKLQNAAEFEDELKGDCEQCSGAGVKERRCYACNGNGQCASCKGTGQLIKMAFDRNNTTKPCHKCNGDGRCFKCGGDRSIKEKCMTCAGTGMILSKTVASHVFRNSCNSIVDYAAAETNTNCKNIKKADFERNEHNDKESDSAFDKTCRLEKSEKRRSADHLVAVREAEKLFAKRCKAGNGEAHVEYEGVQYAIVKNTIGGENFVIAVNELPSSDRAGSFVILPSSDSRNRWYAAVMKCADKIKNWVRVAAKNKTEQVSKEIPIYKDGNLDEVYAYVNAISRGKGQQELFGKSIREPITPLTATQLVKFIGTVKVKRDDFSSYRVSIRMISGDYFDGEIFYAGGTIEEIDKKTIEFLTFVNPKSLENAQETQAKKEALFD